MYAIILYLLLLEFHSKNMKLTDFNEFFSISLPLLKLLADVYAPVHD